MYASTYWKSSFFDYRKVASSRPVYYSIFELFWGATNWDVLLTETCSCSQLYGIHTIWPQGCCYLWNCYCITHVKVNSKFGARLCKDSPHTLTQTPHIYTTHIFACFITSFGDQIVIIPYTTLYNAILRTPRNFLEIRENIKISTRPFYHINLDWF